MGKRISKIITRTGDNGTTGLGDGSRVLKSSDTIEAIGQVDHLNATLGMARAELRELYDFPTIGTVAYQITAFLGQIQNDLFDLGGELCLPGEERITKKHVTRLEEAAAHMTESLKPLEEFILPAGTKAACAIHLCRTQSRTAERAVCRMIRGDVNQAGSEWARKYLNRLSDYFFAAARVMNQVQGQPETYWKPTAAPTNKAA